MNFNLSPQLEAKLAEIEKSTGSNIEIMINNAIDEYISKYFSLKEPDISQEILSTSIFSDKTSIYKGDISSGRENGRLYENLIATLPDIIIRTNSEGVITFISDNISQFFKNIAKKEIIGKNMFSFISDQDKEKAFNNTKLMFERKLGPQNYLLVIKDNIYIDCEVNGDIIRDENGNLTGMIYIIRDITQRVKAEKALKESEHRFKALSEAAFEGIVFCENDVVIDVNDQYAAMFGLERKELIGRKIFDLLAPESKEPVMSAIHSGSEILYEHYALRKDGSIFPVEARGKIIEHDGRKIYVSAFLDVSERVAALESMNKSEDRFRAMIQNLMDIIHILDKDGIIKFESPSTYRLLGYQPGFLIGKNPFIYIHPDDIEKVLADFKETVERDSDEIPTEYRFRHANGKYIILESIAQNLLSHASINGILVTSRDITFRKQVEESLRDSERQFRAFLNSTEDSAFLKNYDSKYLFVNYAMCEMLKINEDEIIGRTDFEIISEEMAKRQLEIDKKALLSDEVLVYETIEGSSIFESRIFKIQLKNNNYGVGGIIRDITNRKKLEKQVIQSEKMSVVGELAGGIAHDLNNILTVLIGNTELLERKINTSAREQVSKYLEALSKANIRAKNIVLQILAFSKRQELNRNEVDLNNIVNDLEKMLGRLIPENIKIIKRLSNHKLLINADVSQIEQIIMNMFINSRDAIVGNGSIEISTIYEDIQYDIITRNGIMKPGKYGLLLVKDSGIGIPSDIIDKIFDPFFTTKEIGKGTGLGLSIVINNVIKNDAFLNLYSETNKGTEFKIFFPLLSNLEDDRSRKDENQLFLGNGEKILIVEDDENIRFLLVEYLKELNYNIYSAINGREALNILHKEVVDAVLTDITMPEMGGKELFNTIRKNNSELPIIAMSGYYQHSEVRNLGFYDILDKPLDMAKVSEIFHKIFNR